MKTAANILIVDDIETNRDSLHDLIIMLRHTPILAENGLIALSKIKKQPIDLVLLDIMMPEMDGYEVLSHIKDDVSLQHIPVIMISALDEMESVVNCIKMGADDYLTKPFNTTLLRARINACLEKKYLRDKEEEYRKQLEEVNLRLEEQVNERTKELVEANERLRLLNKAKGDALKLLYYDFQASLGGVFKKMFKNPVEDTHQLLESVKQSFLLTQIETHTLFFLEIHILHDILIQAVELASDFSKSRQVLIGALPTCGGKDLNQKIDPMFASEWGDETELEPDLVSTTVLTLQESDAQQHTHQKDLCANAIGELLEAAVKFSSPETTITLSCELADNEIVIGIHATGRILPKKEISQIFEIPSNPSKVIPGRHPGLGPSTAKNIITLLGGDVTMENRDSSGVSFFVKLRRENFVSS